MTNKTAQRLSAIRPGQPVRVVSVDSGRHMQGRLAAMGLIPGVEIEVLRNDLNGPFLLLLKGSRIVLGRGMAQKINVE